MVVGCWFCWFCWLLVVGCWLCCCVVVLLCCCVFVCCARTSVLMQYFFVVALSQNTTDVGGWNCAVINNASYQWALKHASPTAAARFTKIGQPLVMGQDIFLSNAGPAWIWNPMEYKESSDKSTVNVYAPSSHTPVDYGLKAAAGFHYCKVLSPARAMEWIYIDGLRSKGGL